MAPVPAPVRTANTPNLGAPGQPTLGTFSTSQTGVPKRNGSVALIAGGVTLLVMAGGAFAAYKAFSGKGAEPAAAASAEVRALPGAEPELKAPAEKAPEPVKIEPAPAATAAPAVPPSASVAAKAAVASPRFAPRPRPAAGGKPATGSKSSRDFGY
jgi:hypothetical protein